MKYNKKKLILSAIAIILVILGVAIYLWFNMPTSQYPNVSCSNEIDMNNYGSFGGDTGFISCYGILAQEKNYDDGKYYIYDHRHKYPIAALKGKDSFKIVDDSIYLIQPQEESESTSFLEEFGNYYAAYYIGGDFKQFEYDALDKMPKYISVDINTGEVVIYPNDLEEISESAKSIFKELE